MHFYLFPDRRVDKYGRHVSRNRDSDELGRFYRLQEDKNRSDVAQEQAPKIIDYARGEVLLESSDEDEDGNEAQKVESDEEEEVVHFKEAFKQISVSFLPRPQI